MGAQPASWGLWTCAARPIRLRDGLVEVNRGMVDASLYGLPALTCPIGMSVMMRGGGRHPPAQPTSPAVAAGQ